MNREAIYSALLDLVWDDATFNNPKAGARKLLHWSDVPPSQQPALFQAQGSQAVQQTQANGLPTKWLLGATLYLYGSTAGLQSPEEALNPIVDAIDAKLGPTMMGTPQTLGGLVEWVRIDGSIETSEGTLGDQAVVIVPIKILAA